MADKGIIYLMSSVVTGLIKIGKTNSDGFEKRMWSLEHNGYCNVTGLKREFAIEVDNYDEKEQLLHTIFAKSRVADSELFALDINLVKQLLTSFEGTMIYPKNEVKAEVFEDATEKIEDESNKERKTNITFEMLKIPIGSTLTYVKDNTITCKTVDKNNKVEYKGKIYSISKLCCELTGNHVSGSLYLKYKGKILADIRKEMNV